MTDDELELCILSEYVARYQAVKTASPPVADKCALELDMRDVIRRLTRKEEASQAFDAELWLDRLTSSSRDHPRGLLKRCSNAELNSGGHKYHARAFRDPINNAPSPAWDRVRELERILSSFTPATSTKVPGKGLQVVNLQGAEGVMADTKGVDPRSVMVVYGRDEALRVSMFDFLRSLGLNPIEWEHAVRETKSGSPHTLDVVNKAFEMAMAVVVLMAGDDLAQLRPDLRAQDDPEHESKPTPQPRANVLLEAGMALALQRDRTIPVVIGNIRPISNISGINFVKLDGSSEKRNALAGRLENSGCAVNRDGNDWLKAGNFDVSRSEQHDVEVDYNQEILPEFSKEEVSILRALYEEGELLENQLPFVTDLEQSKVSFWIGELFGKRIIIQTRAGSAPGGNAFKIRAGQTDLLRRIGVIS